MSFQEITYTDGDDELMVHFDCETKKPIRAYVYADSPLLNFDYNVYDMPESLRKCRWKFEQSSNPLFFDVKTKDFQKFVDWIEAMDYIALNED